MDKLHLSKLLNEQIKPAMGCTEPASIALACAHAGDILKKYAGTSLSDIKSIDLTLDRFVYRNAKSVGIPGSGGLTGIKIAAAIGIFCDPACALNIFSSFNKKDLHAAKRLSQKVRISVSKSGTLYVKANIVSGKNSATATIKYSHDNIEKTGFNSRTVFINKIEKSSGMSKEMKKISAMSLKKIILAAKKARKNDFIIIRELIETNRQAAEYGLKNKCGLGIGANLMYVCDKKSWSEGYIQVLTASAADARMGGENIKIISVCGSGNQGVMCAVPVKTAAEILHINEKRTIEAVLIAVLIECHLTAKFGYLTDLCGAVTKAGFAATAGLTYLLGGNEKQIENAMKLFAGDLTGMLCDGAKSGCSLKLATSSHSAAKAAFLSLKGVTAPDDCGIIGANFEKTIDNIIITGKAIKVGK